VARRAQRRRVAELVAVDLEETLVAEMEVVAASAGARDFWRRIDHMLEVVKRRKMGEWPRAPRERAAEAALFVFPRQRNLGGNRNRFAGLLQVLPAEDDQRRDQ
jgi:hypothetical protein